MRASRFDRALQDEVGSIGILRRTAVIYGVVTGAEYIEMIGGEADYRIWPQSGSDHPCLGDRQLVLGREQIEVLLQCLLDCLIYGDGRRQTAARCQNVERKMSNGSVSHEHDASTHLHLTAVQLALAQVR